MNSEGIKYQFSAKAYYYSSTPGTIGWIFVAFPKELSIDIRNIFKCLEEGWGRMKVTAKIGNTEWKTSIWFDTKQDTYLLPLKAEVRKKEKIELDKDIEILVVI